MSEHFTTQELTRTDTGFPNVPTAAHLANLDRLCAEVLEPVRTLLSCPLILHSAYRSPVVNHAVGGSKTSAHPDGRAADFHPKTGKLVDAFERIVAPDSGITFDQAIYEWKGGQPWIHLGIAVSGKAPRRQILVFTPATYGYYLPYERRYTVPPGPSVE